MEDILEKIKKLIYVQVYNQQALKYDSISCGQVYNFTNENINGYMSKFNYENKNNALSVLASGDHPFNLIYNGIINIDTFDINTFTEYYALGLKLAAIQKYNYTELGNFMNEISMNPYSKEHLNIDEYSQLLYDLLIFMEEKYRILWKKIIDYNYNIQKGHKYPLNLISMLSCSKGSYDIYKPNNSYLLNEENYNKFKINLQKSNITFKSCNIIDLDRNFNNKYDFIFLSNILDYIYHEFGKYWNYKELNMLTSKIEKLLNNDGILALTYIYCYSIREMNHKLIYNSSICKGDIKNELIAEFPHLLDCETSDVQDALIYRKKL